MLDQSDWISMIGIRDSIGNIKRPLLDIQKNIIRKTAKDRQLTWIEDPTNNVMSIRRNNIRQILLPEALIRSPKIINKLLLPQTVPLRISPHFKTG